MKMPDPRKRFLRIKGYAMIWGIADSFGEVILRKSVMGFSITNVSLLDGHDKEKRIGELTCIQKDSFGLYFEGVIRSDFPGGEEAIEKVKSGKVLGLSVSYHYVRRWWWLFIHDPVIPKLSLCEISIGQNPCHPLTRLTSFEEVRGQ